MNLNPPAINDLRKTLEQEIGVEKTNEMTDEDLDHIGSFILEVFTQALKRRAGL
ncbi:MAG: hypothetical protein WC059_02215 [Candidatus Paceibacterota bacterium]